MRALAILAVLAVARLTHAQTPVGPDFQVNTYTTGSQLFTRTSAGPNGDFVVTWMGYHDGSATGAFGQRYDATGAPRGSEFILSSVTTGYQVVPVPAIGSRGDFVTVWWDDAGVLARRFDRGGAPVGAEVVVGGAGYELFPDLARTPDGGFVVVWNASADGSGAGISARRFDAQGTALAAAFVVNTYTTGDQEYPDVAVDASGNFVVVWIDQVPGRDGSGTALFGQRFSAAGVRRGAEFRVNTYTTGDVRGASVSAAPGGEFVVVWTSQADGTLFGVSGRRFDAAGDAIGDEFQVNAYTTGVQITMFDSIAHDAQGNFVVAWWGLPGPDVFAQRFDAAAVRRGQEFRVNASTAPTQSQVRSVIASDEAGNLVVTWDDAISDAGGGGVFGRRVGGLFPRALRVDLPGNGILEPGEVREIRPTWLNGTTAPTGITTLFTRPGGPPGGLPTILDPAGAYPSVAHGATAECSTCPVVGIPDPSPRPAVHWDGTLLESVVPDTQGQQKAWVLHVGESFLDVPTTSPFYRFIETLLHNRVTSGCAAYPNNTSDYCPTAPAVRAQMAVFVLVAKEGAGYLPPACATPMFADVPPTDAFCRFIEELARRGVVAGCGGGNFCPYLAVTREQMAVFTLRTLEPTLNPPGCVPPNLFADVPETSPFCRWVEELANRGIVSGCGGGNYCPAAAVSREQMGVFISVTFGLTLYGV